MSNSFYDGYLTGSVDATVVVSAVDKRILEPLLPKGVILATQNMAPVGQHPVYWSFNFQQHNVTTPIPGLLLNYNELAFVVPCVQLSTGSELLAYPVTLYLNSWLGVLGGRLFWMLNKNYKACSTNQGQVDSSFQVESKMTGIFQNDGPAIAAASFKNFQQVKILLDQPLLTTGWRGQKQSAFIMNFSNAMIQPQKGEIALQEFLPGLSSDILPFNSLKDSVLGGFYCSVPWKLRLPENIKSQNLSSLNPIIMPVSTTLPTQSADDQPPPKPSGPKKKIAILGGGLAGLSAAFELTDYKDWNDYYDVTLYQTGWQLGGKCRTGRGVNERIEEHGIHLFLGFYNNAMRMVRLAYDEWKQNGDLSGDAPFDSWEKVFRKQNSIQLPRFSTRQGKWLNFALNLPENNEVPGIGDPPNEHENIKKILLLGLELLLGSPYLPVSGGCISRLKRFFVRWIWKKETAEVYTPQFDRTPQEHPAWWNDLRAEVKKTHGHTGLPIEKQYLLHAKRLLNDLPQSADHAAQLHAAQSHRDPHTLEKIAHLIFGFMSGVEKIIGPLMGKDSDFEIAWEFAKIGYYNFIGLQKIYDPKKGIYDFESINHLEYRAWLQQNGAPDDVIWSSPIKDIYTLIFAYPSGGDTSQPGSVGAGTALLGAMLIILGYKGSVMYRFRGGTADVVVSPVYEVLKKRGVQFKFFHEVEKIAYTKEQEIETITIGGQIRMKAEDGHFHPTKRIKGLSCWASHPFWRWKELAEQVHPEDLAELQKGDINLNSAWSGWKNKHTHTLKKGTDFDQVILAISVAGLKTICKDIIDKRPEWKNMTDHVATVQTLGVQLWLKKDLAALGMDLPAMGLKPDEMPILDTYANPLNSYADMSDLIAHEVYTGSDRPQSLAYFCGPLAETGPIAPFTDKNFPAMQTLRVKEMATQWLFDNAGFLWPKATTHENPAGLDLQLLVDHANQPVSSNMERLNQQFFIANIDPSERYVLSLPGSSQYRLKTDQTGYKNLFFAGDWIDTGYNMGCAEVAVMSGLMAAQALRKNVYGFNQHKPILKDLNQTQ